MMQAMEYPYELGAIFPVDALAPCVARSSDYWMRYWLFTVGEDRGVPTPYPRGSTPLPPQIIFISTPAPFFPYFFSGYPAQN